MISLASFFFRGFRPVLPAFTPPGERIENFTVPSRLRILLGGEGDGFHFTAEGDFPRRVKEGDILAIHGNLPLLAPLSGIARLEENSSIDLKVDGSLRLGLPVQEDSLQSERIHQEAEKGDAFPLFLRLLYEAGIPSLDFSGLPLAQVFETALQHENPLIILSRTDPEGAIHWERLFEQKKSFPNRIKALLEDALRHRCKPRFSVHTGRYGSSSGVDLAQEYGWSLPPIVAELFAGTGRVRLQESLAEQGIIYLGPSTLWAMMEYFFENRPFTSRIIALRFQREFYPGRKETMLFRIPNGAGLRGILSEAANKGAESCIVPGSIIKHGVLPALDDSFEIFQLYNHFVFNLTSAQTLRRSTGRMMPCTGCMLCDRICPSGISPSSLLSGDPGGFHAERCLDCGLCEYVCESNIPLLDRSRTGGGETLKKL